MTERFGAAAIPADLEAAIVLLRHAESTFIAEGRFQGRLDPPLTPFGDRQAARVADRLADPAAPPRLPLAPSPPLVAVHSPLRRAARTAESVLGAMARRHGANPSHREDDRLAELSQGRWEGRTRDEIVATDAAILAAWRATPTEANAPGGERVVDAADRVRAALAEIVGELAAVPGARRTAESADRSPVAGYRGGALPERTPWSLVVAHDGILRIALLELLAIPLERFWTFPFALCGISIIELRDGRAVLRAHNLVDHLDGLDRTIALDADEGRL